MLIQSCIYNIELKFFTPTSVQFFSMRPFRLLQSYQIDNPLFFQGDQAFIDETYGLFENTFKEHRDELYLIAYLRKFKIKFTYKQQWDKTKQQIFTASLFWANWHSFCPDPLRKYDFGENVPPSTPVIVVVFTPQTVKIKMGYFRKIYGKRGSAFKQLRDEQVGDCKVEQGRKWNIYTILSKHQLVSQQKFK